MCRSSFGPLFSRWLIVFPLLGSVMCLVGLSSLAIADLSSPTVYSIPHYEHAVFGDQHLVETPHHYLLVEVSENNNQEDKQDEKAISTSFSSDLGAGASLPLNDRKMAQVLANTTNWVISPACLKKYILFHALKLDC